MVQFMEDLRKKINDEFQALNTLTVSTLELPLGWLFSHALGHKSVLLGH